MNPSANVNDFEEIDVQEYISKERGDRVPWWKAYPSAAARGAIKSSEGLASLATLPASLLGFSSDQGMGETEKLSQIQERLPSNETLGEKITERSTEIAPWLLAGSGGGILEPVLRALGAGTGGQIAEEAGLPKWAQTGIEILGAGSPSLKKEIQPVKRQAQTVKDARELGLSEEAIAPLIQSKFKKNIGQKFAHRLGRAEKALETTGGELGSVYESLKSSPAAAEMVTEEVGQKFVKNLFNNLEKNFTGPERAKVKEDVDILLNGPLTGESLINFYQKLNKLFPKTKAVKSLQNDVTGALSNLNADLAMDFGRTNKLWSEFADIRKTLNSRSLDQMIQAGEAGTLLYGMVTGNFPLMAGDLGVAASRRLTTETLINPRFQNLSKQMIQALNKGKYLAANRIKDNLVDMLKEDSPEAASMIEVIDFTED